MDRRAFLALVGLAACDGVRGLVARELGGLPARIEAPSDRDPAAHLLARAAFGPWPGELDRVRAMGVEAWIDEQLDPDAISDPACRAMARRWDVVDAPVGEAFEHRPADLADAMTRHTLLRAVYSNAQLREVMAGYWRDHLNVAVGKGDVPYLLPAWDRDVIRAHALGRFRDLIGASALHPAMLEYLDGRRSRRATPGEAPNENQARELMELHTLGVDGGYTQRDVMEAARCLTGWQIRTRWRKGEVWFDPGLHDDGAKRVLGVTIPAGLGARDVEALLDVVCAHPSTARHLSRKICRWLVADDPPDSVVRAAVATWAATRGDLAEVVRTVLLSDGFWAAPPRLSRPFRFVVSSLRALGATTHARVDGVVGFLERMGHRPFEYPTPDGYPLEEHPWRGTLLWRWGFAVALCDGRLGDTTVDWAGLRAALAGGEPSTQLVRHLLGRVPSADEWAVLSQAPSPRIQAALALSSPAFQLG